MNKNKFRTHVIYFFIRNSLQSMTPQAIRFVSFLIEPVGSDSCNVFVLKRMVFNINNRTDKMI